jgi:hypothetical protein
MDEDHLRQRDGGTHACFTGLNSTIGLQPTAGLSWKCKDDDDDDDDDVDD